MRHGSYGKRGKERIKRETVKNGRLDDQIKYIKKQTQKVGEDWILRILRPCTRRNK